MSCLKYFSSIICVLIYNKNSYYFYGKIDECKRRLFIMTCLYVIVRSQQTVKSVGPEHKPFACSLIEK